MGHWINVDLSVYLKVTFEAPDHELHHSPIRKGVVRDPHLLLPVISSFKYSHIYTLHPSPQQPTPQTTMAPLVWLVTGTTSGIGLSLVKAIAARGDKAIATGRNATTRLAALKSDPNISLLDLDITSAREVVEAQIRTAASLFGGRIDVLINNAGKGDFAPIEESPEAFLAHMFEVNFFGAVRVTRAVLPYMRVQPGGGKIGFVGSGMGWAPHPFSGAYSAAKAALGIFAETLEKEVGPLGVHAVCFDLGGFNTHERQGRGDENPGRGAPALPTIEAYHPAFGAMIKGFMTEVVPHVPGDKEKLPTAVIDVITGEGMAKGRKWPVRVALGPDAVAVVRQKCEEQLELLKEWEDVSGSTSRNSWNGQVSQYLLDTGSVLKP